MNRRTKEILDDVQTQIADTASLPRDKQREAIENRLNSTGACFLAGESGSGKSALSKEIAVCEYSRTIWFTGGSLDYDCWADLERAAGLSHSILDVLRFSPARCLVVFDGLESHSDRGLRLLSRLLRELHTVGLAHVHVLISVQFGTARKKIGQLLGYGAPGRFLEAELVSRPSDGELLVVVDAIPQLRLFALRPELRPLFINLKALDWVARTIGNVQGLVDKPIIGLTDLIDLIWEHWTEGTDNGFARSHLLMRLATLEADTLSRGIPRMQIDHNEQTALPGLIQSDLIRVCEERVSFAHDLLGDWARMRGLVGAPQHQPRAAVVQSQ